MPSVTSKKTPFNSLKRFYKKYEKPLQAHPSILCFAAYFKGTAFCCVLAPHGMLNLIFAGAVVLGKESVAGWG